MNISDYKSFRRNLVFSTFIKAMRVFPVDKDKVVVSNFAGRGYGDNPRYVADKLHELAGKKIYCLLKDVNSEVPDYVTPLKYESFESFYHLATAGIWIDNIRKEPYVTKRKNQYYYQAWHGALALKKIEKDAEDTLSEKYLAEAKRDSQMVDLMVSNCDISTEMFSRSFWYDGEVVKLGSPRLDGYINAEKGVLKEKKLVREDDFVVLYAPTFRNSGNLEAFDIDLEKVRRTFEDKTGKNVIMAVKLHPNMAEMDLPNLKGEGILDLSGYPDIYRIMPDCDAVITDYSSVMFEYPMRSRKPVFIYARDYQDYDRGFYFDLTKLPFPFAQDNDSLLANIVNFNQEDWLNGINGFLDDIKLYEPGDAAEKTAQYILNKTGGLK